MSTPSASQIERLLACPGSAALPSVQSTSVYAEAGTNDHAWLEQVVTTRSTEHAPEGAEGLAEQVLRVVPEGAEAEVAFAYDLDKDTARVLGAGLARDYSSARPTEIVGTADVVLLDRQNRRAMVLDWKTGFRPCEPAATNPQLATLGLTAARIIDADSVEVSIGYTCGGELRLDTAELDELDLAAHAENLRDLRSRIRSMQERAAAGVAPDVAEGDHCHYCPAYSACPAKVGLVRAMAGVDAEIIMPLSPESAAYAYRRLAEYDAIAKRIKSAIYALASREPIPLGDGRVLGMRTVQGNERIDGDIAFDVVARIFGEDVANAAVTREMTKTALKDALKGKVKSVAAAERQAMDAIRLAGGASRKESTRVEEYDAE